MNIDIRNKVLTYLVAGVDDSANRLVINDGDYQTILTVKQDPQYLVIRGPSDREIVKVLPAESKVYEYLKVERGQGGTLAVAWPPGSRLFSSTTADFYNVIAQVGQARTIDYNPNEVLVPQYAGEKVYQTNAGYQRWWKAYNDSDPYWDIITGAPGSGENYVDIGWIYDLLLLTASTKEVIGTTADGWVRNYGFDWPTVRSAAAGLSTSDTQDTVSIHTFRQTQRYIARGFYFFDLSSLGMTAITDAKLKIWRENITGSTKMCLQAGSELPPVTLDHFNSGTGGLISDDLINIDGGGQEKIFTLNAAGRLFVENTLSSVPGQILAIVVREYDHDWLNVEPTAINFGTCYASEIGASILKPKMEFTGS
jgi:hypothetical protein